MEPVSRAMIGNEEPTQLALARAYAFRKLAPLLVAPSPATRITLAVAVALIITAIASITYFNGGVRFSLVHTVYLPIIIGALVFGVRGGIAAAVFAGLLFGPFMPLDYSGALQTPQNWLLRLAIFTAVGALIGASASTLRQQLKRMTWMQEHDPLTGLLNQNGLLRQLNEMIASSAHSKIIIAVTQLRSLLEIQNTFGAQFCDQLLPLITDRKWRNLPPGSLMAMIQYDRFAVVITETGRVEEVRRGVAAQIEEPFMVNGIPVHIDFSIGSAHYPEHAHEPLELLKKASIAMNWGVKHNALITVYDDANDHTSHDNMVLLGSLPKALVNRELQIWHQAKRRLSDGKIASTEALLRWQHPERGLIPPGSFIPQAEETALINPLTQRVIEAALADAVALQKRGRSLEISINLSVRNLHDPTLIKTLTERTRELGIAPNDIGLEITESAVMDDIDYCAALIKGLRDTGFSVSIDDFGTGHSSLAYLKRLPVSALKIDQAFVKTLAADPYNQKIVQTILHMAHVLDLETIAEGVEDVQTLELLRQWGCVYAQGFAIHRPAPLQQLIVWLDGADGADANWPPPAKTPQNFVLSS